MPEAVKEAAHAMLQKGQTMRKLASVHPPFVRDLTNAFDTSIRNFRSDVKGFVVQGSRGARLDRGGPVIWKKRALEQTSFEIFWFVHQSTSHTSRHACKYNGCPGRKRKDNVRKNVPYTVTMRCEECSVIHNKNMHSCNTTVNKEERNYHEKYHKIMYPNTSPTKNKSLLNQCSNICLHLFCFIVL